MVLPVQWTKAWAKTNRKRYVVFPGEWIRERLRGDPEPEQDVFEALLIGAVKKKYPEATILGFYSPHLQNAWYVVIEDESFPEVRGLNLLECEIIDKE